MQVRSVYWGGGTPSLVDADLVVNTMTLINQSMDLSTDIEVSFEANPETVTNEKLEKYFEAGINRLSFGLQAWQESLLKYLGRNHSGEDFIKAVDTAKTRNPNNPVK